jgi:hypothetical protein
MTFERLWKYRRGVLSDAELERLVAMALEDSVIVECAHQSALYVRGIETGTEPDTTERRDEIGGNIFQAVRRLALAAFPNSQPEDWTEVQFHIREYVKDRWLSDMPHVKAERLEKNKKS